MPRSRVGPHSRIHYNILYSFESKTQSKYPVCKYYIRVYIRVIIPILLNALGTNARARQFIGTRFLKRMFPLVSRHNNNTVIFTICKIKKYMFI